MKNIFLVRHGQASAGTDNYDRLSKLGIKQAELLGQYWQQSGFNIQAAYSGSLERQQHTAELALTGLAESPTIKTVDALNEYDHTIIDRLFGKGITNDSTMDLQFEQYLEIMQRWHDDARAPMASGAQKATSESTHSGNVESWDTFAQRGWDCVQREAISSSAPSIAFFTSGGVIATILQQVLGLGFEHTMHAIWQTRNASVTHLRIDDTNTLENNTCMVDYNTIPHLQIHYDKDLITQI